MEKKCPYTKEELKLLKARAKMLLKNACEHTTQAIKLIDGNEEDEILLNQLGKQLKTTDMYRTQLTHLIGVERRFYGNEKKI